jgi:hypothetical protein
VRGLAAAIILLACAGGALAQEKLGSMVYLEGEVAIVRDGDEIHGVAIGQDIQAFDTVKTGSDGLAELELASGRTPRLTIKIAHDTQFSLEIAALKGRQQTTVGILGGSISLKVAKLAGAQDVVVRTDSAAMGVRGTQFTVTSPPTGDVLVTCDEGEVVCTDDQGRELSAIAGTVVEKRPDELFRSLPVAAAGLESYRAKWIAQRVEYLQENAFRMIQGNARLYTRLMRELNVAYAALAINEKTLRSWAEEDKRDTSGTRTVIVKENQVIGALLVRLRRIQFLLERVSFRLMRLRTFHDRGFGTGTLDGGVTTTQFFEGFEKDRQDTQRKLARTRFVAKMYVRRNEGRLP